jgi:hypothetical protein
MEDVMPINYEDFDKLLDDDTSKFLNEECDRIIKHVGSLILDEAGNLRQFHPIRHIDVIEEVNIELKLAVDKAVGNINDRFFALRNEGGRNLIGYYKRKDDEYMVEELCLQNVREFITANSNYRALIELKPRPQIGRVEYNQLPLVKVWFESPHRLSYEGVILEPDNKKMVINDRLNLWRGFSMKDQKGDWHLMKDHIFNVLADGSHESFGYIIHWLAWTLQNPGKLAETTLCFVGKQGTGKSTVGRWLLRIFGVHGARPTSARQVTGTFNFQLRDKVFLLMDEAINPESRSAANVMKGLITDSILTYEAKGREPIVAKNMIKMIIISNHEHFIDVELGDRRFAVFHVPETYKENDKYFMDLNNEAQNGGIEAMLFELLNMDLDKWHPRKFIPKTKEREKQQTFSLKDAEQLLYEMFASGEAARMSVLFEHDPTLQGGDEYEGGCWMPTYAICEFALRKMKLQINGMHIHHAVKGTDIVPVRDDHTNGWKFPSVAKCRETWADKKLPSNWQNEPPEWSVPTDLSRF